MSGVPITITALPTVTPATADTLPVWDQDVGITGKFAISALGAIYAVLNGTNSFAGTQTIASGELMLSALDNAAGEGRRVVLSQNTNATTPAPGVLVMRPAAAGFRWLYSDNSGILRIHNTAVISTEILNGAVVGAQTSALDAKDVIEGVTPIEEVLAAVAEGAEGVRRFQYKAAQEAVYDDNGNATGEFVDGTRPYNGEAFEGVIVDYAPRYGMDRDGAHPAGKSLNSITVTGDMLRAVAWLVAENDALRARVLALEEGAGA
jgi:hypothetical protein